jgi:hypothetical protein
MIWIVIANNEGEGRTRDGGGGRAINKIDVPAQAAPVEGIGSTV